MQTPYSIELYSDRRLVSEQIRGMWSAEIAHRYVEEFREAVQPLIGTPWALLTDLSRWATSRPEIVEIIGGQLAWQRENGMRYNANVLPNATQRLQFNRMLVEGGVQDVCFVFPTLEAAEAWLAEHGF
jgi:hypothetical protein